MANINLNLNNTYSNMNQRTVAKNTEQKATTTKSPEGPEPENGPNGCFGFWGSFFRGPLFRIGSDFGWGFNGPGEPKGGGYYA